MGKPQAPGALRKKELTLMEGWRKCALCVCARGGGDTHIAKMGRLVGSQPFPAGADNVHSWCSKVFLVGKNVVVKIRGPVSRSQLTVSGPVFPCLCNDGVSPPPYSHHE